MLLIQILLFIILALCVSNVTDVQHLKLVKKYRNHWKSQAFYYKLHMVEMEHTNIQLNQLNVELEKALYNTTAAQQEPERGFNITNIDSEPVGKPIEQEDGYNWANIDSQTR